MIFFIKRIQFVDFPCFFREYPDFRISSMNNTMEKQPESSRDHEIVILLYFFGKQYIKENT